MQINTTIMLLETYGQTQSLIHFEYLNIVHLAC